MPAVLKAVETGECDFNFSGTTITAAREKRVDFSHPFFDSGLIVAVKATSEHETLNFVLNILKVIGRVIASVWMITGIIWFAAFTASLSSSLTINRIGLGGIKGLTDLSAKTVAVIKGTTSENFMRYHDVTVMVVETLNDLTRSLKDETVEAVVYDAPAPMYIAKKDPEIKVVGEMFDVRKYGVAFPQGGSSPYKEIFNIAILEMQGSGEYQRIYNKWL